MGKVTRTEQDGKFRFELERGRTILVVVLGSVYSRLMVRRPGESHPITYIEAIDEALQLLDSKVNYLILPKADRYDDLDNDIEIYEFFK